MHALLFDKCLVFYDRWVVSVPSFPPTDPPDGDLKGDMRKQPLQLI